MTDLPDGWSTAALAAITSKIGSGATPTGGKTTYKTSGVPLIRSMNVHFSGFTNEGLAYIDEKQAKKLDSVTVRPGDVLLNITGASIGRVTTAPSNMNGARVNQHVAIIRLVEGIESKFVAGLLSSPSMQRIIAEENYGVTRQALTKSMIEEFRVPVPPLAEQQRIIAKIDSLFAKSKRARDQLDHIPRLVEKYKQAILAVELTPEAEDDVVRFGDIATLLNGDRGKEYPGDDEQLPTGHCLFLGTKNVRQGYFDFGEPSFISKEKHLALRGGTMERGDIVMTIRGTLGNCAVYDDTVPYDPVRINSAMMIVRPRVDANPDFLMWTIRSPIFLGWVNANARGSAQPHLRGKDIEEKLIYFPTLEKQKIAVHQVRNAFAWIDRLSAEAGSARKLIDHLDQAVLAKAFQGELVPQDPSDEPASVLLDRIRAERSAAAAKVKRGPKQVVRQRRPVTGGRSKEQM